MKRALLLAIAVVLASSVSTYAEPPPSAEGHDAPAVAAGRPAGAYPIPPEPAPFVPSGRTLVVSPAGPYRAPSEALAAAGPGDTVEIHSGTYAGHWTITQPVRLVGVGQPVLDGGGKGTILTIKAPRVEVTGLVLKGTGDNLANEDAALTVLAPGAYIHGNRIAEALFGVYLRQASHSRIEENEIRGMGEAVGLRGDAIRLWYSPVTAVERNRVEGGRDVMVWFSDRSIVRGNIMRGGRYGLHFMWSNEGLVEANRLENNSVGIFVMYSSQVMLKRNLMASNRGPSGYGLAMKDAEFITAESNWIAGNRVGIYFDNSPYSKDAWNRFAENAVAGNDIGLLFMPATHDNLFTRNDFVENAEQVHLTTQGDLGPNDWAPGGAGNYWSDYAGYDGNGDGRGDMPYQSVSLFEDLMSRHGALRWFRHSPAAAAIDLAARAFPAAMPQPKMADPAPALAPHTAGPASANGRAPLTGVSVLMMTAALVLVWRGWRRDPAGRRYPALR